MFAVEFAHPDQLEAALRLLFQHHPPEGCEGRVRRALALIETGEIPREGVLVARNHGALLGTMVCVPLRGASGLVWPPQTAGADGADIEDALLHAGLAQLRRGGARVVEALLAPSERPLGEPLLRNGFRLITQLVYLRRPLTAEDAEMDRAAPGPPLTWTTYSDATCEVFHDTLLASYEQTEDCPELNGVRDVAEIIAGHKAQGVFDPTRWWLALADGRPVAVLILTEVADWSSWDVAYVGVVPEARGMGIGAALMRRAIATASAAEASQLTLAVDQRNRPARRLYAGLGFEPFDERDVYLVVYR
jgi:ribosomal protein S18 acetylase RimI-like enzyme